MYNTGRRSAICTGLIFIATFVASTHAYALLINIQLTPGSLIIPDRGFNTAVAFTETVQIYNNGSTNFTMPKSYVAKLWEDDFIFDDLMNSQEGQTTGSLDLAPGQVSIQTIMMNIGADTLNSACFLGCDTTQELTISQTFKNDDGGNGGISVQANIPFNPGKILELGKLEFYGEFNFIPEPQTLALLLVGWLGIFIIRLTKSARRSIG